MGCDQVRSASRKASGAHVLSNEMETETGLGAVRFYMLDLINHVGKIEDQGVKRPHCT